MYFPVGVLEYISANLLKIAVKKLNLSINFLKNELLHNQLLKILRVSIYGHTIKPGTLEHGTVEHGTPAEQQKTPEQWLNNRTPRNTRGAPWNTNVTPAEHPETKEPYKTKNNCSDFKENFNTFSIFNSRWKYFLLLILIIYLFASLYLRFVYT